MTRETALAKDSSSAVLRRPTGAAGQKMLTWREYVGIFRRRLWLIILVTLLTTGASIALYFGWREYWPRYTSVALIRCKMPELENPLTAIPPLQNKDIIMLEQQNQKLYLESETFLTEVLQRTDVQNTQWFDQRREDPEKRMKDLKKSFGAWPQRNSNIVQLSMTLPDRAEARLILDEILSLFRNKRRDEADVELRERQKALTAKRDELNQAINQRNNNLRTILAARDPGFEEGASRWWDESRMMRTDEMILRTQIEDGGQIIKNVQDEMAAWGYTTMVQIEVENMLMVINLRNQITYLQIQLSQLEERLGEGHQRVKEMRSSILALEEQLRQMRQQLQAEYSQMQLTAMERELQSKEALLGEVRKRTEQADSALEQEVTSRADYFWNQQQIEELRPQLRRLEEQIDVVSVQINDPDRVRVEIPLSATTPLGLSWPRWQVFVPGGFLLGLLLSLGLVFLLEFIDDSVRSPSDVRRHLNIPLLGMIPFYEGAEGAEAPLAKIAYHHPQSLMGEAYRQLRTNLFFSAPIEEMKSVLITSSSGGCGKTTTAVNLGITLAAEGKRVLLVDANFRRSALNHLFSRVGPGRGLSNVLVGQVPAAEVIHHTEIEGLDVVDAGPAPPNPAVLLGSRRMQDFLDGQKQHYDHIMVDGPPSLVVTDAHILAGLVDGTIAVVRAGDTCRGVVQRMTAELKNNKVHILGIVLNGVRPRKGGYFRESHQLYYDYISPEAAPRAALPGGKASEE